MQEEQFKKLDLLVKTLTPLLAIVTISIGIYQYRITSERDFRKDLFNKQMSVYLETSEIVAQLANFTKAEVGTPSYDTARKKFFTLKYGRLYFLEDTLVEPHHVNFTDALLRFERNDPNVSNEQLQILALRLNAAFRRSIQATWGIDNKFLNPKSDDIIK